MCLWWSLCSFITWALVSWISISIWLSSFTTLLSIIWTINCNIHWRWDKTYRMVTNMAAITRMEGWSAKERNRREAERRGRTRTGVCSDAVWLVRPSSALYIAWVIDIFHVVWYVLIFRKHVGKMRALKETAVKYVIAMGNAEGGVLKVRYLCAYYMQHEFIPIRYVSCHNDS